MLTYPNDLPKPLINGYSETIEPNIIRTKMSDGYIRQRLISKQKYSVLNCSFLFALNDYYEWLKFVREELNEGVEWFNLPVISCNNYNQEILTYKTVRLQGGKFTANLIDKTNNYYSIWSVKCVFDVM